MLGSILARTWDQLKKLWFKLTRLADFLTRSTSRTRWWYISLVLGRFLPSLRIKRLFVRGSAKGSFCSRQIEFSQICDPNTASKNKGLKIPSISHIYRNKAQTISNLYEHCHYVEVLKKVWMNVFWRLPLMELHETAQNHKVPCRHESMCVTFMCIYFFHIFDKWKKKFAKVKKS